MKQNVSISRKPEQSSYSVYKNKPAPFSLQKNNSFFDRSRQPFFKPVVQPKLTVNAPGDIYEKEADAIADKVMRMSDPQIQRKKKEEEEMLQMKEHGSSIQRKCTACEAEESSSLQRQPMEEEEEEVMMKPQPPAVQRNCAECEHEEDVGIQHKTDGNKSPSIQRKLTGQPNYHPYLLNFLPGRNPARDPASRLTPGQRIAHVEALLQALCPGFQIDASTGEVSPKDTARTPDQYAAGGDPTGCCCLYIFTRPISTTNWRILISDVVGPHTRESDHVVVIPGPDAPISYGSWTGGPAERRVLLSNEVILGHELCGHAALKELQAHPPDRSRLSTDVHDPTVNIQNLIASEQGVPASDLRGLAGGGSHRGESFARIVISGYPINKISPYSIPDPSQHQKLTLATRLVQANDFFVDIIGHTDPSGDDAVNNRVSLQRANVVKSFIASRVRNTRHLDRFDPSTPRVNRFRSVTGARDSQPPPAALQGNPDNWRRVEILLASFPASTENQPAATPTTVTSLPAPAMAVILSAVGDACEQKMVEGAYPGISVTPAVPAPVP